MPSREEPNHIHFDISADHAKSKLSIRSFPALDQYEAEVTNFARAVRGDDVPFYGLADSRANMTVLDAVFSSATSNSWVEL